MASLATGNSVTCTLSSATTGNGLTVSGNTFVIPRAGVYRLQAMLTLTPLTGSGYIQLQPLKNSAITVVGTGAVAVSGTMNYPTMWTFDLVPCVAGDALSVQFANASGATVSSNGGLVIVDYIGI
jgi:hypothetical protein